MTDILFYRQRKEDNPDPYIERLRTVLAGRYPDRTIETRYLDVTDVIDIPANKNQSRRLIIKGM